MYVMRIVKLTIFFLYFCSFTNIWAQLSTNEKPVSFGKEAEMRLSRKNGRSSVTMPPLDRAKIKRIDAVKKDFQKPVPFGYIHEVNYNLTNSGTWYELSNGDKLWQLNVICPDAKSIHFCYNKFWIPEGGKLFVYSKDKKQILGAFTSKNNKGSRDHLRGFATGLVYSSSVVLEYYQPKDVTTEAIISIEYVVHGYKLLSVDCGFNKSDSCQVNINCNDGYYWKGEKRAVSRIIFNKDNPIKHAIYCTGSLVSTSNPQGEPFLLTAGHCLPEGKDANWQFEAYDNIMDDALFYWHYEMPSCDRDTIEPPLYSTTGAIIVANNQYDTDFALLRLTEDPKELSNYIPYYLGWDNSGQSGGAGVCIHHPMGDVKKISIVDASKGILSTSYNDSIEDYIGNHWRVKWTLAEHGYGRTEPGSSGSPLFNASHKVIGQLHGGDTIHIANYQISDWFSKFSVNWNGGSNNTNYRRLDCWLDSLGTNNVTMEGLLYVSKTSSITDNECIYGNILITRTGQLTIQSDIEQGVNGTLIVESGGILIIDGGKLTNANVDLKPGATLRIINNGTIETRSGFKAPVGAKVDIKHGKIL